MRILPAVGLAILGTAAPVSAQWVKMPEQIRTQEYETVAQPDKVDSTTQATDLRFKEDGYDRMTVPVKVAGHGPYRFLIDTGADRTAISSDLARQLRLNGRKGTTLHSVTGETQIETANVSVLDITAKEVRDVDAALLESEHMGADGILGLDSLRSQRVLFDFKKQTLTIVPSAKFVAEDKDTIVVTAKVRNGRLILTKANAEHIPVTLVIDTGAQVSLGNEALRRKLSQGGKVKRTGEVELQSVSGAKLMGEYTIVRELSVGGITLKKMPVIFTNSPAFKRLGLDDKPALLLGMNALRSFDRVSIDFARKKLKVVLPETSELETATFALR
ncbi:retropepsin-like aspartic protease [Sphingomonas daechungensis]|uniref:Retroviral-like aspartic protease family protein n=1 Tax=Sphingomonas daechungensis TaxID=1176646 RepID=A0ABX6T079_9SPHN|nr:retroviral-like aspartic protease family protein [Sphingomonas daechungensis]QNP42824.1 retroviral-like aspartic protease family protein [Sphingomonas daechungensis]